MDMLEVPSDIATFHRWPQELAKTVLTSILRAHLPHSNPLYNRILAPQNTPSRYCLFAATFPPSAAAHVPSNPLVTILFADRSRHNEAQIWLFNPLTALLTLDGAESQALYTHADAAIRCLREAA